MKYVLILSTQGNSKMANDLREQVEGLKANVSNFNHKGATYWVVPDGLRVDINDYVPALPSYYAGMVIKVTLKTKLANSELTKRGVYRRGGTSATVEETESDHSGFITVQGRTLNAVNRFHEDIRAGRASKYLVSEFGKRAAA